VIFGDFILEHAVRVIADAAETAAAVQDYKDYDDPKAAVAAEEFSAHCVFSSG